MTQQFHSSVYPREIKTYVHCTHTHTRTYTVAPVVELSLIWQAMLSFYVEDVEGVFFLPNRSAVVGRDSGFHWLEEKSFRNVKAVKES